MKYLLIAIILTGCIAQPVKPTVSTDTIKQEQAIALAILDEIREIESQPVSELSIADRQRRLNLYDDIKQMRRQHIFAGRNADHLSLSVLSGLQNTQ